MTARHPVGLRGRVFGALAVLLVVTVVGAWLVAGGAVLRPLIEGIVQERAETAVAIAKELEQAPAPRLRAREIIRELGVRIRLLPKGTPSTTTNRRVRRIEVDDREVLVLPASNGRVLVPIHTGYGQRWLMVQYSTRLGAARRRVVIGLGLIACVAIAGAWLISRWVLRPLDVASAAMAQVAAGDLAHRAPEGKDAAGQMGARFNQMADRVQALVEGQHQLVAAVSHELRTPLARMRLLVELMRDDVGEGTPTKRLDALEREICEMDALVGELLESARLRGGGAVLKREPVALAELVEELVAELGDRAVEVRVPHDLLISADRFRLARALGNLLSNADRYAPEGTAIAVEARRTRLAAEQPGAVDGVVISVADRGPGVPPDLLPRLFEPFFRAPGAAPGGHGLGLAIVKQVAEAHGGTATARLREGGGLEVLLTLPG